MLNFMMITSDPDIAYYAVNSGVDRIFVDLEVMGKQARQGHLDTVISHHTFADIKNVHKSIGSAKLLVRVNPFYEYTQWEVDRAIECGADILMLPMCNTPDEVRQFCSFIAGRAISIPLIETTQSLVRIREILRIAKPDEVYLGLNDLHLAMKLDFMFEPLASGLVDYFARAAMDYKTPFGFGGIARLGCRPLPAELVLAEHTRLKSSFVILSRSFHGNARTLVQMQDHINLAKELHCIRDVEKHFSNRNTCQEQVDRLALIDCVRKIVLEKNKELPQQQTKLCA